MKQYYNLKLFLALCLGLGLSAAWGQTTVLTYTGGMVEYIVPPGVTSINIEAMGAQGASGQSGYVGGRGASMSGDFAVTPGSSLIIAVGGRGAGQSSGSNGGGGGGSFVVVEDLIAPTHTIGSGPFAGTGIRPLIIAGGGSGTRASVSQNGNPGVMGNMGTSGSGSGATGGGTPVTAPEAGGLISGSSWGSGGGGFVGNGANDGSSGCGGSSFINGAGGGTGCGSSGDNAAGGFGCGGQGRGSWGGGGGGGYSGGQGGRVAGGGGSYNIGADQVNATGVRDGDGLVTITVLCLGLTTDIPVTGVCIGDELTLYAESETGGTITWSGPGDPDNGVAFAPPLGTNTYYAISTSSEDCNFSIDISASEVPDIVAHSSLPTACEGSEIVVWGTGGDTYTWTGTGDIDPIDSVGFVAEAGTVTYTLIGSILGCEGPPEMITLVGAPQPDVIATASPSEICLGDSYTLTGSGTLATSFDWGDGIEDGDEITPATVGTFVHFVVGFSDVGCPDTAYAIVTVNPVPFVDAGMDVTVCEGHEVTLSGTGATDYTWSPAITDGEPFAVDAGETTYTVTGTDENGCTDTDEVIVTGVELPYVASSIVTPEYFGYDGAIDITVAGGSGSYTYNWSHGPFSEDVTGLTAGTYTVVIDDITINPGMCPVEAEFTVSSFVGLENASITSLNAYPNPTVDRITVVYNGQFNYEVTTLLGQTLVAGSAVDQEELSLKDLANGTYIVKVTSGTQISYLQVVKQ